MTNQSMWYDSCGRCRNALPAALPDACTAFDPDPLTMSYLCMAAAAVFAALAGCVACMHLMACVTSPLRRSDCRVRIEGPCHDRSAMPSAGQNSPRIQQVNASQRFARWQERQFRELGTAVARQPWATLAATSVLALCAASGLSVIQVNRDVLTMWLPSDSPAKTHMEQYTALSGWPRPRSLVVLIEADEADAAVAGVGHRTSLKAGLTYALSVHRSVVACGLSAAAAPSGLALIDGVFSPLLLWGYDEQVLEADDNPLATIRAALAGRTSNGVDGGVLAGSLRSMLRLQPTVGESAAAGEGDVQSVENGTGLLALLLVYTLDGRLSAEPAVEAFERRVRSALAPHDGWNTSQPDRATPPPAFSGRVHIFSESALADDIFAAVGNDAIMIMGSIVLMSAYVSACLSRHRSALRWQALPAGAAVVSVLLATLSAFGVAALLGIEYNQNVNMAIFVILGVGIDDAFVIVRALDDVPRGHEGRHACRGSGDAREQGACELTPMGEGAGSWPSQQHGAMGVDGNLPVDRSPSPGRAFTKARSGSVPLQTADDSTEEAIACRVGVALGSCGSAILLSSTTNAIAFALGSRSQLPALQGFCAYAAVGMVFDLAFQLTFFVAVVALDERRQACGRAAIPCLRVSAVAPPDEPALEGRTTGQGHVGSFSQRLRMARGVVLCAYSISLGLSVYASRHVSVGFRPEELVAPRSAIAGYFEAQARLLPEAPELVEIVVLHQRPAQPDFASSAAAALVPLPLSDNGTFAALQRVRGALHATAAVEQTELGRPAMNGLWTDTLARQRREAALPAASELSAAGLDEAVASFLDTPDGRLLANAGSVLEHDGVMIGTRWRVLFADYGPEAMVQLRAMLELSGVAPSAFAFAANDIYYEQDAHLLQHTSTPPAAARTKEHNWGPVGPVTFVSAPSLHTLMRRALAMRR